MTRAKKINSADDLTLGNYGYVLDDDERWAKLRWPYERADIVDRLRKVASYRNAIAHWFSPDLCLMAISDAHHLLHLWLVGAGKIFATVPDPGTSPLQSVAFSRDDRTMVAGDATGNSHLWKLS